MKVKWRRIVALTLSVVFATGLAVLPSGTAQAVDCGDTYPTSGSLETVHLQGGDYVPTFRFTLTDQQLHNVRCVADFVEIDFHIYGFSLPPQWDDYRVQNTNLPGAIHDVAASDLTEATPAVTEIRTLDLRARVTYFATLWWSASTPIQTGVTPSVSITWVPSYWARSNTEQWLCFLFGSGWAGHAWCIFPVPGQDAKLWDQVIGLPQGRLTFNGSQVHKFGTWASSPPTQPPDAGGSFTPPPLPPQTLTTTQSVTVSPSGGIRAYQPFTFTYKVRNMSGSAASIQRLAVAVRGPSGNALDVQCANGSGVTLQANQEFTCNASLPTGYGQAGTYYYWPDWLGYDGNWHAGQLGEGAYLNLAAPFTLSTVQPVSVGPSDTMSIYSPLQWSYRIRNTSGVPASVQRFVVAVRGPAGDALDVPCQNGNGVSLQPDQEWTCAAYLPTGYGSTGTFTFWPDWMDYNGVWHQGQLGASKTLNLVNGPTLYVAQPVSVGPSNYRPKLTSLYWSYRVRNTTTGYASIQRLVVAVRGPAGDALDVQCLNGTGVTLAPGAEWTCDAQLPTGYGSTGNFTFWADWLGYDGSWHHGQLGGNSVLTLY